ncbi:MAG TPA: response regulator, partial [Ferruginibacter sp.]|nr:response regulator [Ferruginibacter sp.]
NLPASMAKTILIYDDDAEILLLCKAILSKHGFNIVTRSKCEHIEADIESCQPHLILMDLWIPDIGGEKAIALVKENISTAAHPPILIFSANADIKNICEKVNADGFVEKPFSINTLVDTIKFHLKEGE